MAFLGDFCLNYEIEKECDTLPDDKIECLNLNYELGTMYWTWVNDFILLNKIVSFANTGDKLNSTGQYKEASVLGLFGFCIKIIVDNFQLSGK